MSRRPPRYQLVTDALASHRGVALQSPGTTFGSSRPLVAAVLVARGYAPDTCACGSTCACAKIYRWVVERVSYTRLAAASLRDQLRRRGIRAVVVAATPAPTTPARRRAALTRRPAAIPGRSVRVNSS